MQPRHQLAQVEGLGQVVVGAGLQPGDPVVDGIARADSTQMGMSLPNARNAVTTATTVEFRHLDVQDQRVMRFVGQQPQRLFTVRRDPNVENPNAAVRGRQRF